MYNQLQKMDYIEYAKQRNEATENIYRMFEKASEYEEELGKDLCDFTTKDIISLYRHFFTHSYYYINNYNSQMKIYCAWCLKNNLVFDGQNHYAEMTKDMIVSCINKGLTNNRIVSREELISIMNDAVNTRDKFLFLSIFEGLYDNSLITIRECTMDNFDLDTKEFIMKDGKRIHVSDTLISYAKESVEDMEYYAYNNGVVYSYHKDSKNYVLKGTYNSKDAFIGYSSIKSIKSWYEKKNGLKIFDPHALKESGRIDMILRLNKKYGTDSATTIYSHYEEISYVYGTFNINGFLVKYKDFLRG